MALGRCKLVGYFALAVSAAAAHVSVAVAAVLVVVIAAVVVESTETAKNGRTSCKQASRQTKIHKHPLTNR